MTDPFARFGPTAANPVAGITPAGLSPLGSFIWERLNEEERVYALAVTHGTSGHFLGAGEVYSGPGNHPVMAREYLRDLIDGTRRVVLLCHMIGQRSGTDPDSADTGQMMRSLALRWQRHPAYRPQWHPGL